jgi:hypothetical protein
MSDLENSVIPLVGSMMADISVELDEAQQKTLCIWALKTAMVQEGFKGRDIARCYKQADCLNLRTKSIIPPMTRVWLGRFSETGLFAQGTDFWPPEDQNEFKSHGCVTTILVGHLTVQVVTVYFPDEHKIGQANISNVAPGPWNRRLLDCWPIQRVINWPPAQSFQGAFDIFNLHGRWKQGTKVALKLSESSTET